MDELKGVPAIQRHGSDQWMNYGCFSWVLFVVHLMHTDGCGSIVRELDEGAVWMKVGLSHGKNEKRALTQGPQNKLSWNLDEGPQNALIHHRGQSWDQ